MLRRRIEKKSEDARAALVRAHKFMHPGSFPPNERKDGGAWKESLEGWDRKYDGKLKGKI